MQGMDEKTGKYLNGVEYLKQSIKTIITTRIRARVMRRNFGSNVFNRIDNPINGETIAEIYSDIVEALFNFEPNFSLNKLAVNSIDEEKLVLDLEGEMLENGQIIKLERMEIK